MHDVVYVRFIRDTGHSYEVTADVLVSALVATVQHRPELGEPFGGWRLHSIGDYVLPEHMRGS